jgi:4a-hydroxytetrahydrobiopterin dehydratase
MDRARLPPGRRVLSYVGGRLRRVTALEPLSRTAASTAVEALGWRYLLGTLNAAVPVTSLADAVRLGAAAVTAGGQGADRVELSVQTRALGAVTPVDVELVRAVTAALADLGAAPAGATSGQLGRPVQMLELAVDALDIPAVRPFWKAVLALVDDPADAGPTGGLVDPAGQLPTVWFQQMDAPRPQRNRIHLDITVSHDEGVGRVRAALAAGGQLVEDSAARAFWVLADAEGNEVCVCTWQDRD